MLSFYSRKTKNCCHFEVKNFTAEVYNNIILITLSNNESFKHTSDLDDLEAEVTFVEHYDLILVRAIVDHVPQR